MLSAWFTYRQISLTSCWVGWNKFLTGPYRPTAGKGLPTHYSPLSAPSYFSPVFIDGVQLIPSSPPVVWPSIPFQHFFFVSLFVPLLDEGMDFHILWSDDNTVWSSLNMSWSSRQRFICILRRRRPFVGITITFELRWFEIRIICHLSLSVCGQWTSTHELHPDQDTLIFD